jgi:hypothetical protein
METILYSPKVSFYIQFPGKSWCTHLMVIIYPLAMNNLPPYRQFITFYTVGLRQIFLNLNFFPTLLLRTGPVHCLAGINLHAAGVSM